MQHQNTSAPCKSVLTLLSVVSYKWSQSSTSSSTFSSGVIGWDWGNILDSSNFNTFSGEGPESGLSSLTWLFRSDSSLSSDFYM